MKNIIKLNKDQFYFFLYLVSLFFLTSIHNIYFFLIFLIIIFFYKFFILKKWFSKSIFNITFFSLSLSGIYFLYKFFFYQQLELKYFILFNLRVLSIYTLTFIIFQSISIFNVFSFSKNMIVFLSILLNLINSYERFYKEYYDILKSKGFLILNLQKKIYFLSYLIFLIFLKIQEDWKEISFIMESRGFYYDE